MSRDTEYFKIPITDFTEEYSLPFDIYFEFQPDKIQKLAQKRESFSIRRIPFTSKKQPNWLLLKKDDYQNYVKFSIGLGGLPITKEEVVQNKLSALKNEIANHLEMYTQDGVVLTDLNNVQNTLQNVFRCTFENPLTCRLLEKIEKIEGGLYHSISVAAWSLILAERIGWIGEPKAFTIAMCALFHDVGFHANVDDLLQKTANDFSEIDSKVLDGHVFRGRDILMSIPGLPNEVITVAMQHHELVNGTGYPEKLLLEQIHPYSRLISIVNRFCEIYVGGRSDGYKLIDALKALKKEQNNYDLRFFKALEDVLDRL